MQKSKIVLDFVKKLSISNNELRKKVLLHILDENKLPYEISRHKIGQTWIENIIISINPSENRIVIGAHYDSVIDSVGANDNASSVGILIQLAKDLVQNTTRSIEIVFFDREEYEDHGSEAYITFLQNYKVTSMINLDMCGFGDIITINIKNMNNKELFFNLLQEDYIIKHNVCTVEYLPNGDDLRFTNHQIPNISIAALPKKDSSYFVHISKKIKNKIPPTHKDYLQYLQLDVLTTMHNASNDNINIISESSLMMIYNYLIDGILF